MVLPRKDVTGEIANTPTGDAIVEHLEKQRKEHEVILDARFKEFVERYHAKTANRTRLIDDDIRQAFGVGYDWGREDQARVEAERDRGFDERDFT